MPLTTPWAAPIQVNDFVVYPVPKTLVRHGQVLRLGGRAFDVLWALLHAPEHTLTKDELLRQVWRGCRVEDSNLHVQVSALRRLLGSRIIITLPKQGYRLGAQRVEFLPDALAPNQPAPLSSSPPVNPGTALGLIGRAADLARLRQAMLTARWVTLTGPGGVGKSALAQAYLADVSPPEPVLSLNLSGVDTNSLLPVLAMAAGLPVTPPAEQQAALQKGLADRTLLLFIDNAEHLLEALKPLMAAWLASAPGLRCLMTSRQPAGLDLEQALPLAPLRVAADDAPAPALAAPIDTPEDAATVLFLRLAQGEVPREPQLPAHTLAQVRGICRRLGGLPLALRLVAAQWRQHPALTEAIPDPNPTGPAATDTLSPLTLTMAWAYDGLSPTQQAVFRRIAVFGGVFPHDVAGHVAADADIGQQQVFDSLAQLVAASLVQEEATDIPGLRLLDSARDEGLRRLRDAGEWHATHSRLVEVLSQRLQQSHEVYIAMPEPAWLHLYKPLLPHLRVALEWSSTHEPLAAVRLLGASARFFQITGLFNEALPYSDSLLPWVTDQLPAHTRAGYWVLRWNAVQFSRPAEAPACYQHYLAASRQSTDPVAAFLALCAGCGIGNLSLADRQQHVQEMHTLLQPHWPLYLHSALWLAQGMLADAQGDRLQARAHIQRMAHTCQTIGKHRFAAHALTILSTWSIETGQLKLAEQDALQAITLQRHLGAWNLVLGLRCLVAARLLRHNWGAALAPLGELIDWVQQLQGRGLGFAMDAAALCLAQAGQGQASAQLCGFAQALLLRYRLGRDKVQQLMHDETTQRLQRLLPGDGRDTLVQQGSRLDPDGAIRLWHEAAHGL